MRIFPKGTAPQDLVFSVTSNGAPVSGVTVLIKSKGEFSISDSNFLVPADTRLEAVSAATNEAGQATFSRDQLTFGMAYEYTVYPPPNGGAEQSFKTGVFSLGVEDGNDDPYRVFVDLEYAPAPLAVVSNSLANSDISESGEIRIVFNRDIEIAPGTVDGIRAVLSGGVQNPWGVQLAAPQDGAKTAGGSLSAGRVQEPVPSGALDQTFSVGLSLLGMKTDEASFQLGKLETRSYGIGTQIGIPLNARHSLAIRGVLIAHDYDGNTLDDKVDFALGVTGRGELFQTEAALKPFLGIGLSVSSETTLGQTAKDELFPSEVTKTSVSLELDVGARFWLASGRRFFLDLIAGLMRSDLFYEETTLIITERNIDGQVFRIATEDIDRGYFLLNGSPASVLSRAEVVFGYRF